MTAQDLTLANDGIVPIDTVGVAQETALVQVTEDTATFIPSGNRDFIVLKSSSGTVKATATCYKACNMPLACAVSPCTDNGLHSFVMSATSAGGAKTFYIPYIEHYINPATGKVLLTFDVKANTTVCVFRMP